MREKSIRSRRSQMEIMGLMIVVILLIVGVMFAVKFVALKKSPETRQKYTRTQLASNLGMALMESTTVGCRGTAIKDLMMDCAGWPGGTIVCEGPYSPSSCDYVNATVFYVLNQTLVQWKTPYEVKAWTGSLPNSLEGYLFYFNNAKCTDNKPGEAESFFLPTDAGLLTMKIYICE